MMETERKLDYNFEKRQGFSKQNFDIVERRNKNKKELEEIISNIENVDKNYQIQKRNVVANVRNDDSIINKDEVIEEKFAEIERCIEIDKKNLMKSLRQTINKQAKYLLILKEPKMIYEFYKLITSNPLDENYAKLESEIYREFLMTHPSIENIIISYSIYEDEKNIKNDNPIEDEKDTKNDNPIEDEKTKLLIKEVTSLVEQVETTEKSKDFKNAYDAIKLLPDCDVRNELSSRLQKVSEKNESRYFELQNIIIKDINDKKGINKDVLEEFDDRYRYLSKEKCEEAKDNYSKIIEYYNNAVQDEYQQSLEKEDFKKHSLSDKVRELMGSVVTFVAGTKVAKKIKNKRLNKLQEKLDNEENDNKKTRIENKINNIKDSILDNDIVTGVRLFKARNKLAKQKFKLYHDSDSKNFVTSETGEALYKTKATDLIGKKLSKGLSKITSDEELKNDRKRVINVLDEYLELTASGTFDEDSQAFNFLEEAKEVLTESEYNGYLNELLMISNYRYDNDGIPYHINNDETYEVDNIIKFYDSEDYNNALNKPLYIKGK